MGINYSKFTSTDCPYRMERNIWNEFPEELYEAVLARLPILTLFRFRTVCRKWNSLLTSHRFCKQFEELPLSWPLIYANTNEDWSVRAIYDPSVNKWHRFPTIPSVSSCSFCLVTSAGGLVCYFDILEGRYYVGNPLTQSFRALPRSVHIPIKVALGMTLNWGSTSGGYQILQVDLHGNYEVYDSIRNSWTPPGIVPFDVILKIDNGQWTNTVSIGDTFYLLRSDPDGIVSYSTETCVWKQFIVPPPSHLASDTVLAECAGKIMLAGLLIAEKASFTCVCIWELQNATLVWKEVDRMPKMFNVVHDSMKCMGNKGLLMLSLGPRPIKKLVAYNMLRREWMEVPRCVLPGSRKHWRIRSGVGFHPCPSASA